MKSNSQTPIANNNRNNRGFNQQTSFGGTSDNDRMLSTPHVPHYNG